MTVMLLSFTIIEISLISRDFEYSVSTPRSC